MVKMVVVICWGAAADVDSAGLAQSHHENPQFLQSLQDLVIFSEGNEKRKFCSEAFKGVDL